MSALCAGRRLALLTGLASMILAAPVGHAFEVERVISPGGIEAWLVEQTDPPVVSVRFAFEGGSALDPEGKEGLARFVSFMLDEGAGDLDSQAFQEALAANSVRLGFNAGLDRFTGSLYLLSEDRELAFSLLGDALRTPRFDPEPTQRMRTVLLSRLEEELSDPLGLAFRIWAAAAFPDHPYGRPASGTLDGIAAITKADLRAFVRDRFARDNLSISVVGDITAGQLASLLDSTFGGLPEHASDWELPPAVMHGQGETLLLEIPLPQTVFVFGQPGPGFGDEDRLATRVVAHILGGPGFLTRLMYEMRELRGLTYGVNAGLETLERAGTIQGATASVNERAGEALQLLLEQWDLMGREGPTAEEVIDAKLYLQGAFAVTFDTTGSIAEEVLRWQVLGYQPDHAATYLADLEALTPEAAIAAARRWFAVDDMLMVVFGQPVGITPTGTIDPATVKGLMPAQGLSTAVE